MSPKPLGTDDLYRFESLRGQVDALNATLRKLFEGDPTSASATVSGAMAGILSALLSEADVFLGPASPLAKRLPLPLAANALTYADGMMLTALLRACFDAYKLEHSEFRHGRSYWLVQQKDSATVDYVLADRVTASSSADS